MCVCVCVCVCVVCVVCVCVHVCLSSFASCVVIEQSLSQQKHPPCPDPESLKLRFMELKKQWAELNRRECTSSVARWSVPQDSRSECMPNMGHMTRQSK